MVDVEWVRFCHRDSLVALWCLLPLEIEGPILPLEFTGYMLQKFLVVMVQCVWNSCLIYVKICTPQDINAFRSEAIVIRREASGLTYQVYDGLRAVQHDHMGQILDVTTALLMLPRQGTSTCQYPTEG